jgi:hypothetical protein
MHVSNPCLLRIYQLTIEIATHLVPSHSRCYCTHFRDPFPTHGDSLCSLLFYLKLLCFEIIYYTPFMKAGSVLMSIGAGLITAWKVDTNMSHWIGPHILTGVWKRSWPYTSTHGSTNGRQPGRYPKQRRRSPFCADIRTTGILERCRERV